MKGRRVPLRFPQRGIHTGAPFGAQPILTTREGRNVRNRDPVSKRQRGGQRPGWEPFVGEDVSGAGSKVQRIAQAMVPRSLKTWTAWDGSNFDPEEWGLVTPGEQVVYDVAIDSQRNVWALDGSGSLVKLNSEKEVLATISIPVQSVEELVRRVRVDELDAVYVAVARREGALAGRILRYARDEEGEEIYSRSWQIELDGAPRDFDVRASELRIVMDYEGDGGALYSKLVGYGNAFGTEPDLELEEEVPRPANSVSIRSTGDCYVSCPENPDRAGVPGGEGFTQRGEGWSPHLLNNASERIYAWGSATSIWNLSDGKPVEEWQDIRDLAYQEGLSYDRVHDLEPRNLFRQKKDSGDRAFRRPPVFRPKGMGAGPAVRFNGDAINPGKGDYNEGDLVLGTMLQSRWNQGDDAKEHVTGSLNKSRSLFPAHQNARWVFVGVFRIDRRDRASVALAQNGATPLGIVVNGGEDELADLEMNPGASGRLGIYMGGKDSGGNATTTTATTIKEARWDQYTTASGTFDNDTNVAIVTIVSNGGGSENWYLRVNGVAIDRWQVAMDPSSHYGPDDPYTILGSAYRRPVPWPGELFSDKEGFTEDGRPVIKWDSFFGYLSDYITVHADSSSDSTPHDLDVDVPDTASGFSGSIDQTSALADWTTATEVEVLEGWLAGKCGVSHLLPNGYSNGAKTNGTFWDNHPFGGVGNWPVDNAYSGVEVPSDTRVLYSPRPILAKYGPAGALRCAYTGPGVGLAAVPDPDGNVLTMGAFLDEGGSTSPILRKLLDKGDHFVTNDPSSATLELTAVPSAGDYIEIDDDGAGSNPTVRWEFYTGSPGSETATLKYVKAEVNVATTMFNLQLSIYNARQAGHTAIDTSLDSPVLTLYRSGATPSAITTSGPIVASSWTSSVQDPDAWEWEATVADSPTYQYPRLWVDDEGDLYVPISTPSRSNHVDKYDGRGNGDGTTDRHWRLTVDLGDFTGKLQVFSVVGDPVHPDYGDGTVTGPEYLYLASDATDNPDDYGDVPTVRKYRMVRDQRADVDGVRDHHTIVVAGGNVSRIQQNGTVESIKAGVFDPLARVEAVGYLGYVFLFDGFFPQVYVAKDGKVRRFTSTTGGEVPRQATIAALWNSVLLLSGDPTAPSEVYGSAMDDPFDWDLSKNYAERAPAFRLGDSRTGPVPDVVTSLVPLSDDLCLICADHSIHRLTGHPWSGGQLDLVDDSTGVAPGRSFARDSLGAAYLFTTLGGVVRATATSVESISDMGIESELRGVDLRKFRIELQWDSFRDGLFVFQVPIGAGGVPVRSWFWERRFAAWWEDTWAETGLQPTCSLVVDGDDPDDRRVLIGCEDGWVRFHSDTASSDDDRPIESSVILSPALGPEGDQEWRFYGMDAVLADDQDGCMWTMLASDTPERLVEYASGAFKPGRNARQHSAKARGSNLWVRLSNAMRGRRWALEQVQVGVAPAGRRRVR